jgi:hypothetical protein
MRAGWQPASHQHGSKKQQGGTTIHRVGMALAAELIEHKRALHDLVTES